MNQMKTKLINLIKINQNKSRKISKKKKIQKDN